MLSDCDIDTLYRNIFKIRIVLTGFKSIILKYNVGFPKSLSIK